MTLYGIFLSNLVKIDWNGKKRADGRAETKIIQSIAQSVTTFLLNVLKSYFVLAAFKYFNVTIDLTS